MKPHHPNPRRKLCLGCGDVLDGLISDACSKCDREYDAKNPETFRWELPSRRNNNVLYVAAIYVIPPCLMLILFLSDPQPGFNGWLAVSAGPTMVFNDLDHSFWYVILKFILVWSALLFVVCRTHLKDLSYDLHVTFSILWFLSGCLSGMLDVVLTVPH